MGRKRMQQHTGILLRSQLYSTSLAYFSVSLRTLKVTLPSWFTVGLKISRETTTAWLHHHVFMSRLFSHEDTSYILFQWSTLVTKVDKVTS